MNSPSLAVSEDREAVGLLPGHVYVSVAGLTGTGKSAVLGEIEIALRALGLTVEHDADFQAEKNATHADWQAALDLYKPIVVLSETNVSRALPAVEGGDKQVLRDKIEIALEAYRGRMVGLEYATDHILAAVFAPLSAGQGNQEDQGGWQPMETLPHPQDAGMFWAAIRVGGTSSPLCWEVHAIALDDETHEVTADLYQGWDIDAYEFWQPCIVPPPPSAPVSPGEES